MIICFYNRFKRVGVFLKSYGFISVAKIALVFLLKLKCSFPVIKRVLQDKDLILTCSLFDVFLKVLVYV